MNREIIVFLKMNDVEYKENLKLSKISPIKIGGAADVVVYPRGEEELVKLVGFLDKSIKPYKILGRMSNVLPPDEKYGGTLIRTDHINNYSFKENVLEVGVGASMPTIAKILCERGLSGFEGLSGIPGSIGGAIVGNAGAFGREISDLVIDVKIYDLEAKKINHLSADQCGFSYRDSYFKQRPWIVLSARLKLSESDTFSVASETNRIRQIRKNTQPTDKPSLGSTFKRPSENISAAWLIDQCGLKGFSVGVAAISKKHAGFIINNGGATAADYLHLSEYVAQCVYERFKIKLCREIEIM